MIKVMWYVYLLISLKNSRFYIGCTNNIGIRTRQHNNWGSIYTSKFKPWFLIYYEAYADENLARVRERKLKHHGSALVELKKRLKLTKDAEVIY